ncbi:hypothetical protein [Nesterenkonia suensis]
MNTLGAIIGSLLAVLVPGKLRGVRAHPQAALPHDVTRARRLLAMACDGVDLLLVAATVTIVLRAGLLYVLDDRETALDDAPTTVGLLTAAAVWTLLILSTGRSVGDFAVQLRYTGSYLPEPLARALRAAAGVVGFSLLMVMPGPGAAVPWAFVLVSIIVTLTTEHGRGLPGVASQQDVADARVRTDGARAVPSTRRLGGTLVRRQSRR